jgi:hypothetical protein
MTPADKRVLDLLDRWLTSIELHLKYTELDETSYRQVQPWPEHDRPAKWILELSQQKILQLKTLCRSHIASNDTSFAESLELMGFLSNLVGLQNIKRYIPLADVNRVRPISAASDDEVTREAPLPNADNSTRELPHIKPTPPVLADEPDRTRELPKLKQPIRKPAPAVTAATKRPATKATPAQQATSLEHANTNLAGRITEVVVADAVRLLKWGREWHELTELIARMAERPAAAEIRRILRNHKASIEAQTRA